MPLSWAETAVAEFTSTPAQVVVVERMALLTNHSKIVVTVSILIFAVQDYLLTVNHPSDKMSPLSGSMGLMAV